ncbi:MAG: 2OG-Fe(II) oxygenase [Saprospiraceae bacterium]
MNKLSLSSGAQTFSESLLDSLVDSLAENSYAVVDNFLSASEVEILRKHLLENYHSGEFKLAGIGNAANYNKDTTIRGDQIFWLDPETVSEDMQFFFDRINATISYLNRTCFLALQEYEFHFACYQPGSFFKRHLDAFKSDDSRKISIVVYLNEDWNEMDGGNIRLYLDDETGASYSKDFYPIGGRMVCFRSDLIEHEVFPSGRPRLSVTGWLKTRPVLGF